MGVEVQVGKEVKEFLRYWVRMEVPAAVEVKTEVAFEVSTNNQEQCLTLCMSGVISTTYKAACAQGVLKIRQSSA